jgi:hypothetical protein
MLIQKGVVQPIAISRANGMNKIVSWKRKNEDWPNTALNRRKGFYLEGKSFIGFSFQ